MTTTRCAVCRRPIFFAGTKDAVGRYTSTGQWRHWDAKANADHDATPRSEEA